MRTINISISDIEFSKFGIKSENLNFTELIELVTKELTRQNLNKSLELAEKYGISKMTMEDITNEVKAVRSNAKSGNWHERNCFGTDTKELPKSNYKRIFHRK